tara:strand:+ start:414 stop:713 length:300 start_codon:yes stop_codon:yes gene_type:complete
MWWFLFILFLLISIFSSVALYYSLRRINQYENFLEQFYQIIQYSTAQMKKVDDSGHYESDDETGFFFKQLKDIQLLLGEIFEIAPDEEKPNAETEKQEE